MTDNYNGVKFLEYFKISLPTNPSLNLVCVLRKGQRKTKENLSGIT
jgi:hypothetical protein